MSRKAQTSRRIVRRQLAGAWVCALAIAGGPALAEERFYLTGGRLHVGDGTVIEHAVVEVAGERIAAVGSGPEAAPPEGAAVIDTTGMELTPGFIAAASQLGLVEISGEPLTRDTTRDTAGLIRSGYDPAPAINARSTLIPVQAIEGITSAAVSPTGALLSGQVAWIDLLSGDFEGIVARPRIAQRGALEADFEGSRAAALTRLRIALEDARFLAANRDRYERGDLRPLSASARDLDALQPVLSGEVPLVMWSDRAGDILALVALAREFDLRLVIEGAAEAWLVAGQLADAGVAVLITPSRNLPEQLDALAARSHAAARLAEAGVEFGLFEENGAHNVRNVRQEAGIAIAYGLDPERALHAVTLAIAKIYGVEREVGSVEVGKVANLVVWDGDPFELSTAPRHVFIRGREVPPISRQTLLRDRYLERLGLP